MDSSKTFFSCLFWWVILVLISPFFIVFVGIVLFWKFVIIGTLAKVVLPNGSQGLDSFDATLATDSFWENPLGALGQLLILEGTLDVEQNFNHFRQVILEARGPTGRLIYQKLREIPREFCGYFFWEIALDFRLEDHFRVVDRPMSDSDLKEYTENCFKSAFTRGRPLWEIHFLTNYQPEQPSEVPLTVLIFKFHHVIADGYTLVKLNDRLMGNTSAEFRPNNGTTIPLAQKLNMVFTAPYDLINMYWDAMADQNWYTQKKKSQDFTISWKNVPLKLLKDARKKTGVRFAALGLASLSGALQKYAESNMEQVEGDARIMIPLPWPNHPTDRMANHWTMCIVKVPFNDDPMTRIAKAEKELVYYTSLKVPSLVRWFGPRLLSLLPSIFLRRILRSRMENGIIYSSVPGPSNKELRIENNIVRHIIPLTGTQYPQTGIIEFIHTYNETATIIVVANKEICSTSKSVDKICNLIQEELEQLCNYGA